MPTIETLNEFLPEQKRLPLLNIDCLVNSTKYSSEENHNEITRETESNIYSMDNNQDDLRIKPVDEVAVVDRNNV